MPERHADALFAPACDGVLDGAARRRFDDHLASCGQCAAAFADHCAASEAVRGLPPARMPVPVRLPVHAPRAAAGGGLVELLRSRRALPLALGGITAAAAAAVVVGLVLHGGNGAQTQSSAGAGAQALVPSVGSRAEAGAGAPAIPGTAGADAVVPHQALANVVRVERSGRPGEVLVVATDQRCYAPGSSVTVYAALLEQSVADALVPSAAASPAARAASPAGMCEKSAFAQPANGVPPAAAAAPQPLAGLAGGRFLALPSAVVLLPSAPSTADAGIGGSPSPVAVARPAAAGRAVFTVTIPSSAPAGEVLDIVASVSTGVPAGSDSAPITALLQITVG